MSSSSKSGSRHNSGAKIQKSSKQKKTKAKTKKPKADAKYLKEETVEQTLQEVVEKTLVSIERLGRQVFALSPFSQYYDDWLVNLRQTVLEFETTPGVRVDEMFTKEREQALLEVQGVLAEQRMQETALAESEKTLYEINRNIGTVETEYTEKSQILKNKHNADIQQLTNQIKTFIEDIDRQKKLKFGVFQFNAKKTATKELEQTQQTLTNTIKQLEETQQSVTIEQDKLYESYTAKKQELLTKMDSLRKEIEQLEIDTSKEARKETCAYLNNAINELIKRLPAT